MFHPKSALSSNIPRASDNTSMHIIKQRDNLLYSCNNLLYNTTSSNGLLPSLWS